MRKIVVLAAALGFPPFAVLTAGSAAAHPHVFVTVKSTVQFTNNVPTAVRHDWRFDDMFSAYASQGLDKNGDGTLDRAELQDLAEINVASLKEFDFFTFGKVAETKVALNPAVDYWLDHDGLNLTLHLTLPVAAAVPEGPFTIEVYDPSYLVAFEMEKAGAAALDGAPAGCRIDARSAPDRNAAPTGGQKLSEDFFTNLDKSAAYGAQFANVMTIRCGADAAPAASP